MSIILWAHSSLPRLYSAGVHLITRFLFVYDDWETLIRDAVTGPPPEPGGTAVDEVMVVVVVVLLVMVVVVMAFGVCCCWWFIGDDVAVVLHW